MTATVLRKELHKYIDTIPARNLATLKPMLSALAEPLYVIEPANPDECAMVEKRMKDTSVFTPLSDIIRNRQAKNSKKIKA
jgi:hypothetical protein